jgi:ribosomal protein S12 methylthiotransferase accessory factor YcaO
MPFCQAPRVRRLLATTARRSVRPAPRSLSGAAGRGRPPQAAARRAGLEFVEKLLPTNLTSSDTTERNDGMLVDFASCPSYGWSA